MTAETTAKKAASKTKKDEPSKAIAIPKIDDDMLREVATVDDAMRLAYELYGEQAVQAEDYLGNGFTMVKEKTALLNRPMFVLATRMSGGTWGQFATVFAVMMDGTNERVMFTDGSTGVCDNVKELHARTGRPGGWIIKSGLRVSEYPTCLGCGRPRLRDEECDTPACADMHLPKLGEAYDNNRGEGRTFYFHVA